jgi:hypothetical protein
MKIKRKMDNKMMNTQMKIIHNYKEDDEDEVYLDDEDAG